MAFALIKTTATFATVTSGTASAAFTGGNTAGNLLVVITSCSGYANSPPAVIPFTDTAGNSYPQSVVDSQNSGELIKVWVCSSAIGGANTLNLTQPAAATRWNVWGLEFSGNITVNALDNSTTKHINTAINVDFTQTITPSVANELIIWTGQSPAGPIVYVMTTPAGFTQRQPNNTTMYFDNAGLGGAAGATTLTAHTTTGSMGQPAIALAFFPAVGVNLADLFQFGWGLG